ncbi:MAG: CDP-alcohol phosphatidyltransferase family protein [Pseudomonadota bacterium]
MSHNTWIHRAVRGAVRPLVGTRLTPNHLTTLRLATGLAAAALLAVGAKLAVAAGAALFLVSMLLDRADGELARLADQRSVFGHRFDVTSDGICNALVFVGLGAGLGDGTLGGWALLMGVLAGSAVAIAFILVWRLEAAAGAAAAAASGAVDPDDAMIVVPVAVLLGLSEPLLIAAAVGAPAFAAAAGWQLARRRVLRGRQESGA